MGARPAVSVGVCGFGRCGSTMVMQMLAAGGLPPVVGAEQPPHEADLRGLWTVRPEVLAGHAVKLLDSVIWFNGVPPAPAWRFIWLDRDPLEQARSHIKFLSSFAALPEPEDAVRRFAASYRPSRSKAIGKLHGLGSVLTLRCEDVLADPAEGARQLERVWPGLDVDATAAVVHRRDGRCRPDLAVEVGISREANHARRLVQTGASAHTTRGGGS